MQSRWFTKQFMTELTKTVEKGLEEVGIWLSDDIRDSMKDGDWKPYRRPWGMHWSSRPGNPPAKDWYRLAASLGYAVSGSGVGRYSPKSFSSVKTQANDGVAEPNITPDSRTVAIGSNVPYALFLELGTFIKSNSRSGASFSFMAPRPYLRTALDRNTTRILAIFGKHTIK